MILLRPENSKRESTRTYTEDVGTPQIQAALLSKYHIQTLQSYMTLMSNLLVQTLFVHSLALRNPVARHALSLDLLGKASASRTPEVAAL